MIRFAAAAFLVFSTFGMLAAGCAAGDAPAEPTQEPVGQADDELSAYDVIVYYYSDAQHTDMVGFYQRDCDRYVDSWGVTSAYVTRYQYVCDGTGGGTPQCYTCTPSIVMGSVGTDCSLDFCPEGV